MSISYSVFLSTIDDSAISEWLYELNQLGMDCKIHPDFSFNECDGFLPFKINIKENSHELLLNRECLTGCELYMDTFDIEQEKPFKRQGFIEKLRSKPAQKDFYYSAEIDENLKDKKWVVMFSSGVADTFEFRIASLGSATLAKVCNGLCHSDSDEVWYDNATIIETALNNVLEYETSLKPNKLNVYPFTNWHSSVC